MLAGFKARDDENNICWFPLIKNRILTKLLMKGLARSKKIQKTVVGMPPRCLTKLTKHIH